MKPAFFSKYEWWYHLAMMPVCFALGNYYFVGERYFTHFPTFLTASSLAFALYWFSVILLTALVRRIAGSPEAGRIVKQMLGMLFRLTTVTTLFTMLIVWAYSIVPALDVSFKWASLWPIILLAFVADAFLCAMLGLFYSMQEWKNTEADDEKTARQSLETEFDTLKGQVNPHFLFNSLNTLSSLIGADPAQAEDFVEDLARIYRYMLQAARTDLVPLQSELAFLEVYVRLLQVRYHDALIVNFPAHAPADLTIPPLMLQILVDNALQYNVLSAQRPLTITIDLTTDRSIRITNNVQMRHRTFNTTGAGLRGLTGKLLALTARKMEIMEAQDSFSVTIPLLPDIVAMPVTAQ